MHPKTYEILEFDSVEQGRAAGFTVPLTKPEAEELKGMNRKERRAWLAQQRKAGKK